MLRFNSFGICYMILLLLLVFIAVWLVFTWLFILLICLLFAVVQVDYLLVVLGLFGVASVVMICSY